MVMMERTVGHRRKMQVSKDRLPPVDDIVPTLDAQAALSVAKGADKPELHGVSGNNSVIVATIVPETWGVVETHLPLRRSRMSFW